MTVTVTAFPVSLMAVIVNVDCVLAVAVPADPDARPVVMSVYVKVLVAVPGVADATVNDPL